MVNFIIAREIRLRILIPQGILINRKNKIREMLGFLVDRKKLQIKAKHFK